MNNSIIVDTELKQLVVPHLGITLRSLMGAAANANEGQEKFQCNWGIVYRDQNVGKIRIKNF